MRLLTAGLLVRVQPEEPQGGLVQKHSDRLFYFGYWLLVYWSIGVLVIG